MSPSLFLITTIVAGPCPADGSCCMANGTPGCDDTDCCEVVCATDPFCCDAAWDLLCALRARAECEPCGSECDQADITGDGIVDGKDIALVLANWGPCPPDGECIADLNDDDIVDGLDLGIVLRNFNECEPDGACCIDDESCVPANEMDCLAAGGIYQGDLVECTDTLCVPPGGGEGCTPGYWKQSHHFDSWPAPYTPDMAFSDVFEDAFGDMTLVAVLSQGGGKLKALGRHTVAALLNAASDGVDYDLAAEEVIAAFNDVFPGTDDEYEDLKDALEDFNQQGCPLN